jgi:hypothetical protein
MKFDYERKKIFRLLLLFARELIRKLEHRKEETLMEYQFFFYFASSISGWIKIFSQRRQKKEEFRRPGDEVRERQISNGPGERWKKKIGFFSAATFLAEKKWHDKWNNSILIMCDWWWQCEVGALVNRSPKSIF